MNAEYSFRVTGRLTPAVLQALHPLTAGEATTDTMLMGPVTDRAALHGFIARIEALGLELVELQRLPPSGFVNGSCPRCGREERGQLPRRTVTDALAARPRTMPPQPLKMYS